MLKKLIGDLLKIAPNQEALAKELGVEQATISRWHTGATKDCSGSMYVKVAELHAKRCGPKRRAAATA